MAPTKICINGSQQLQQYLTPPPQQAASGQHALQHMFRLHQPKPSRWSHKAAAAENLYQTITAQLKYLQLLYQKLPAQQAACTTALPNILEDPGSFESAPCGQHSLDTRRTLTSSCDHHQQSELGLRDTVCCHCHATHLLIRMMQLAVTVHRLRRFWVPRVACIKQQSYSEFWPRT